MGTFSVLNNISGMFAQNNLMISNQALQKTLFRLSSGSRITNGGDDPGGLNLADGLKANITALSQSVRNTNDGVGKLQVADGALSQVTNLLNRAVTLATEAGNGTLTGAARLALDSEFTQIKNEIDRIGSLTQYNGSGIFNSTVSIFITDGTSGGASTIAVNVSSLSQAGLSLNNLSLSGSTEVNAQNALTSISAAVATVANYRGAIGANMNRLQAAANVLNSQVQNTTAAEDAIRATDVASDIVTLTRLSVLNQTGLSALSQSNQRMQSVLSLLR
ncbi:MAG: flagellin [Acidobacteria bacterium]|nr:flagellin [Acidobacteriota bacterium]